MKAKSIIIPIVSLTPLLLVIILSIFGITFHAWIYLILAIVCPLVAGVLWHIYRDAEKKISGVKKIGNE